MRKRILGLIICVAMVASLVPSTAFAATSGGSSVFHIYNGWTVVKEATCIDYGYRTSKCMDCGKVREEVIKPLGHQMVYGECVVCGYKSPSAQDSGFTDVASDAWYSSAVNYVSKVGIMKGATDKLFKPNDNTTRGMIVTILYRLEGQPAFMNDNVFSDVAEGSYYEKAVVWASGKGIVKGYSKDSFGPEDKITREQLAAILYRYALYKSYDMTLGEDTNVLSYVDFNQISEYAMPSIQWACGADLLRGDNKKQLNPKGNATRAEVAAIMMRFCRNVR